MVDNLLTDLPPGFDRTKLLERLSQVLDPELDEPILTLGFVRSLLLRDGQLKVGLQLPTSWCAINFAFMMAEDVRDALLSVDGVHRVIVCVGDHAAASEIEAAVNSGTPFASAFSGDGAESLAALRGVFLRKGFLIRQERLLRELRTAGLADETISALRVSDGSLGTADVLARYLQRRAELGLTCSPDAPLIVNEHGALVPADRLEAHYQRIRTLRVALEANGSFCRAVLATRRDTPSKSTRTTEHGERQCSDMMDRIPS